MIKSDVKIATIYLTAEKSTKTIFLQLFFNSLRNYLHIFPSFRENELYQHVSRLSDEQKKRLQDDVNELFARAAKMVSKNEEKTKNVLDEALMPTSTTPRTTTSSPISTTARTTTSSPISTTMTGELHYLVPASAFSWADPAESARPAANNLDTSEDKYEVPEEREEGEYSDTSEDSDTNDEVVYAGHVSWESQASCASGPGYSFVPAWNGEFSLSQVKKSSYKGLRVRQINTV